MMMASHECALHLVVARHAEDIRWLHQLPWLPSRCTFIYSTNSSARGHSQFAVPNTGREALCYLSHLRRVLNGEVAPAKLTAFIQAQPHCAWDANGDPLCAKEVSGELSGMNAESVEARGGFVLLGSGIPREFTSGVVPEVRPCYLRDWSRMSQLPHDGALELFSALEGRGIFTPGAQFVIARSVLTNLGGTLRGWLLRAEEGMRQPGLMDSAIVGYGGESCCNDDRHTCFPWLLERLWAPLFFLNGLLGGGAASAGEEHAAWRSPSILATTLLNRTTRHGMQYQLRLPMSVQLRWIERQYTHLHLACKKVEAALPRMSAMQRGRVMKSLAFKAGFVQPPDDELYKQRAHLAECLNERLRNPDWLGIGACGEKPQQHANPGQVVDASSSDAPSLEQSLRHVRRIARASVAAGESAHALDVDDKARLARLILPTEIAAVVPSASGALAAPKTYVDDWPAAVCEIMRAASKGCAADVR